MLLPRPRQRPRPPPAESPSSGKWRSNDRLPGICHLLHQLLAIATSSRVRRSIDEVHPGAIGKKRISLDSPVGPAENGLRDPSASVPHPIHTVLTSSLTFRR